MVPSNTAWDQIQAQYSSAFKVSKDWSTPTWCPATQPGTRFRPSTPVHSRLVRTGVLLHGAQQLSLGPDSGPVLSAFKVSKDRSTPTWCPATQPGTRFKPSTPVHSRLVRTGVHLHGAQRHSLGPDSGPVLQCIQG
jgi:hypothetical protein